MSHRFSVVLAASVALCASAALAKDTASQKFISKAVQGNLAEIDMGKLAQSNGASDSVKSLGDTLVKDHTDANAKATSAATALGATPPTEPSKAQMKMHDKLAKLSGAKFDKAFAAAMVADHKKDIADYTKESKMKATDDAVTYASDELPTLKSHLQAAQAAQKDMRKM